MGFLNWGERDGVRSDDPWNVQEDTARYARAAAQSEAGREKRRRSRREPQKNGPYRPDDAAEARRGGTRRNTAVVVAVTVVIMLAAFIIALVIIGIAAYPVPEYRFGSSVPAEPYEGFDDYEDFFAEYYSGTSTGVNDLPRTEPDPSVRLDISSGSASRLSLQEIYDKCIPSIVAITADLDDGSYSWGTGIIMTEDGYIITNSHVLDGSTQATVTLYDDSEYEAELVGYDAFSDLAVIKIGCTGLTPAEFGDSNTLRVGDDVVAIGNPLGEELRGTMTNGIVSAINRDIYLDGVSMTLIQTNAAINGGNSGGALIDMYGRVVGVTNMKMVSYDYSDTIEGIGFAIPTDTIKPVVDSILAEGRVAGRPGIGVTVGAVPPSAVDMYDYDIPLGLYVSDVTPGSGADLAGIEAGDILTAADGVELYSNDQLNAIKNDKTVGDVIVLTVWRNGEYFDAEVEIMDMSELFN